MRMRHRSNAEGRLSDNIKYFIPTDDDDSNTLLLAEEKAYLPLSEIFEKAQPLYLEIGCGQGLFTCETAKKHPEINIIGIERISNVILSGVERAATEQIENVRFLRGKAELLSRYFENESVERIFLNFSTPLPKKGYARQRLTSERFLKIYKSLLKKGGRVYQKTDDKDFFEFSVQEFEKAGFKIIFETRNLHENGEVGIITEYERKFINENKPIFALTAEKE